MGLLTRIGLTCLALGASAVANATDWQLALDVRAVASNGRPSFLADDQGKLRFDEDHQGLRLGRLRMALDQPLGELFAVHVDASAWDGDDKNPIDLTEAWLEFRPYPRGGYRTRLRLGAFYPPLSLENRARGWESPYTLTPSAISAWIGEEVRTVGLEAQVEWLGTRLGHAFDLQFTAAAFGWNDPAGTMLASHGFAFHDRQTTLFGRVGESPQDPALARKELFREMDGRAGFHVGAQVRYHDRAVLNVLHFDNRADPREYDPAIRDFAWLTRFDAAALRVESDRGWVGIAQALAGDTVIAPGPWLDWRFDSQSLLLGRRIGGHTVAARYDAFRVVLENNPSRPGSERGHANALAWSFENDGPWRFALEWLRVSSQVRARTLAGASPLATESQLQFSARYAINGSF